jgi:hypothetical protein
MLPRRKPQKTSIFCGENASELELPVPIQEEQAAIIAAQILDR